MVGVFAGASLCSPELLKKLEKTLPGLCVYVGYGATETSKPSNLHWTPFWFQLTFLGSCVTTNTPKSDKYHLHNSCGYPIDKTEVKIVDSNGNMVKLGEKGKLFNVITCNNMLHFWSRRNLCSRVRINERLFRWWRKKKRSVFRQLVQNWVSYIKSN